ncbi:MAG: hypothetical protein JXM79_05710 [Sedimentisphaerales bacterium]|nr:hypothetical protein [Sedimentisphaerales bacterium]
MRNSSVYKHLRIVRGCLNDYKPFARFHYRDGRPGPVASVFVLKSDGTLGDVQSETPVGVIVYTMASPVLEMRNVATDNFFAGLDRGTQLALVNKNVRRISRVIIEPRFRGLGLASHLVRETMPQMNVPIIEAVAIMGRINPFLEKAGMTAYPSEQPVRTAQLIEAFSLLGIEAEQLIEPQRVQQKLDYLSPSETEFIERAIKRFLKSHGRRRTMLPGLERTRYILTRLTTRPFYYIWFNPDMAVRRGLSK